MSNGNYTYLSNIEIETHTSDGYVSLTTKTGSTAIAFEIIDGNVMVNMTEFRAFCEREDVSLSSTECDELLSSIEMEIGENLPAETTLTAFCVANKGRHYAGIRFDIESMDWDEYYPEVDHYGKLTGSLIHIENSEYETCGVGEPGTALRIGEHESDAVIRTVDPTHYEIIPDTYGPQRIVFANRSEAEKSLAHLQSEYPDTDWTIVETTDPV